MTSKSFPYGKATAIATEWYTKEISKLREDSDKACENLERSLFGERSVVAYATAAALPTCTASGSKTGKTLTATANGALIVDGVAVQDTDVILVKDQVAAKDNGVYTVTNKGDSSNPFVLTRNVEYDDNSDWPQLKAFFVTGGVVNQNKSFRLIPGLVDLDDAALSFEADTSVSKSVGEVAIFTHAIPLGAAGDHLITLPTGTWKLLDAKIHMESAGESSDTARIYKDSDPVSDAMSISGAAGTFVSPATLDPTYTTFVSDTHPVKVTTVDADAGNDVAAFRVNLTMLRIA